MNQERYWRNLIADEIKAEHDKVKKYYQKKGMNAGGMSQEEHTRLNIFLLCESISRTMKNSQDAPREIVDSPENIIATPVVSVDQQFQEVNDFVEEQILSEDLEIPGQQTLDDIEIADSPEIVVVPDPIQSLVKNTPYQNEFGEIL
jgi:hypothetical protein